MNQIIMELFLNEKERSSEKDYRTEKKIRKRLEQILHKG